MSRKPSFEELEQRAKELEKECAKGKRAEEALRESEEKYRILVENAGEAIFVAQEGMLKFVNKKTEEMIGYSKEELTSRPFTEFIHPDDRALVMERHIQRQQGMELPGDYCFRIVQKSGETRWAELSVVRIDWEGKPATLNFLDDITERRRAEESLRQSEATLQSVFRAAPVGICIMKNRTYQRANAFWCESFGYPEKDILFKDTRILYESDEEYERVGRKLYAHMQEEGLASTETRLRRSDGVFRDVVLIAAPLHDDDLSAGAVTVIHDVTERKRSERQRRRHMKESERFNRLAVGREQRILELKREVNQLSQCLGRPRPYPAAVSDDDVTAEKAPDGGDLVSAPDEPEESVPPLEALFNLGQFQELMDGFCESMGIASAIIDLQGVTLVQSHWKRLCTDFHRTNEITRRRCIESDTELALRLKEGHKFTVYQCLNGLTDAASPIVIEGRHVANVFVGQFLTEPPQEGFFRRQAAECGFDERTYLEALREVPIIAQEKLPAILNYLTSFAVLVGTLGLEHFRQKRSEARLAVRNEELIREREAALNLAEDAEQARIATERSRKALRESQKKFKAAFEGAHDAITITTKAGRVLDCNRRALEIYGLKSSDAFLDKRPADFSPPFQPDGRKSLHVARELINKALDEGGFLRFEWLHQRSDGEVFPTEVILTSYQLGSETVLQATIRDITERKRAEEERKRLQAQLNQAQKMESVGRLAGGVAHDFNNMLGIIIGNAEMAMLQIDPSESSYKNIHEILKASQRSADLVRQLLAFARKQTIRPEVMDLNDMVSGMLKMLHRLIGEDIRLNWIPGKDVGRVRMDPTQVNQILANLMVNSRDAIPGVGKITIETANKSFDESYSRRHEGAVPGEYVLLGVSDTGAGMSPEVMEHVFDPFFTTKELGRGTGLGLATVYGIVKQNNGFINVYSEQGLGTTIKIYLPRFEGETVGAAEKADERKLPEGTETLLLAEDEASLLNVAREILAGQGYTVLAARTPTEALMLAERHKGEIHLLLTDVVMPEMNGRELMGRLQALRPRIKALFMSGYTANVVAHHGVLDEGVHFIEKPFSPRTLAEKVREVLDKG
ncbi:MAG: PAS domain S-box protein [Deltaproteobacteria bacterium]|nr:PAS domain S-box protein [Deltaproteobacteria bacterium]